MCVCVRMSICVFFVLFALFWQTKTEPLISIFSHTHSSTWLLCVIQQLSVIRDPRRPRGSKIKSSLRETPLRTHTHTHLSISVRRLTRVWNELEREKYYFIRKNLIKNVPRGINLTPPKENQQEEWEKLLRFVEIRQKHKKHINFRKASIFFDTEHTHIAKNNRLKTTQTILN